MEIAKRLDAIAAELDEGPTRPLGTGESGAWAPYGNETAQSAYADEDLNLHGVILGVATGGGDWRVVA